METIGFVGLGQMGWPMAQNLARAGVELLLHDADPARAEEFASAHGGTPASSPADFGECGVVVTMLPDGGVVRAVLLEWEGGLAAALKSGALVVDMSSSNPADTRQLAGRLATSGIYLIDAPVSGGTPRAVDGTLSIMVGGDAVQITRAEPVLDLLGHPARRFRTGPLGTGHAMKALNNFVAATSYAATVEALVIGRTVGLTPDVMAAVINASTGRSFSSDVVVEQNIVSGAYATGFKLGLLAKDVAIAADIAAHADVEAPCAELANRLWSQANAALSGLEDHSKAHQAWWDAALVGDGARQ